MKFRTSLERMIYMPDVQTLAFLVVMGFIAAFIDSVVGGGGLVSIPALMWTGLPPLTVLGTNKAASVMGAVTSFVSFLRAGKMDVALIKKLFPLSFIGSMVGVFSVRLIPSDFLRPLVIVMLIAVAIYSALKKDWGDVSTYHGMTTKMLIARLAVAFIFGFYDGFFGPGTGALILFGFLMIGFDFLGAAANARALNFASNLAAFITFTTLGITNFWYAVPMGLSMIVGAACGTRMALSKGAKYVRPLFIGVTTVLIGKQLIDLLG